MLFPNMRHKKWKKNCKRLIIKNIRNDILTVFCKIRSTFLFIQQSSISNAHIFSRREINTGLTTFFLGNSVLRILITTMGPCQQREFMTMKHKWQMNVAHDGQCVYARDVHSKLRKSISLVRIVFGQSRVRKEPRELH